MPAMDEQPANRSHGSAFGKRPAPRSVGCKAGAVLVARRTAQAIGRRSFTPGACRPSAVCPCDAPERDATAAPRPRLLRRSCLRWAHPSPLPEAAMPAAAIIRPDYRLDDALWAPSGQVFVTGTQALVRLALMQRARDAAAGLATKGFISGYRGSPLGQVDQVIWKAGERLGSQGIRFLPAINEELGATAVLGTQRVESDPQRSAEGVFALWYGKGPGVDRAGDALKHGNAYGASPHGGVLMVAGDDHGCVSSSMPHQSDQAFQAWLAPVVSPADVGEIVEFGLYGWALSRFSGNWVGLTALSEVVESGATVDLDRILARAAAWADARTLRAATGYSPPPGGLHYRWPDLPSLAIEERLHAKIDAVRAFARINAIDRDIVLRPGAAVGIVTAGKAHHDFMEVLRRLEIPLSELADAGVRVHKVGLTFPLGPSRLIALLADWLARHSPALDRRHLVRDFTPPELLSNAADAVRRRPWFCAGCPHNTSTRVPEEIGRASCRERV